MKTLTQESITLWGRLMAVGGKALLLIWAFLSPIAGVMLAVGLFIGLDTVVGVWSAKRGGNVNTFNLMPVISFKDKKDRMFSYGYNVIDNTHNIGLQTKIKFK